jgi:hypothetical protein
VPREPHPVPGLIAHHFPPEVRRLGATVGLVISPTQPTWRLGSNVTTITIGRDGS